MSRIHMTHRQVHFVEKLGFQITAIAAVAAVYWFVWPFLIPNDPEWPICFIGRGAYGHLGMLIGFACAIGLACGAMTATARPQTAAMALVIGLGGLSLRSPRIRSLLWATQDSMPAMYWQLALELLVLLAVVVIASLAAGVGRRIVASLAGGLIWRDPLVELDKDSQAAPGDKSGKPAKSGNAESSSQQTSKALSLLGWPFGIAAGAEDAMPSPGRDATVRRAMGILISITASAIVVFLLLRSPERGQILFALFAGCFLGVFASQRVVPTRANIAAWVTPVALGVLLYVLAAVSSVGEGPRSWMAVERYAQILPIDWITAGLGGGMLGHWEDLRMREARRIDEWLEESQAQDGD